MPSILAGGAFGALCSRGLSHLLPGYAGNLVPGIYALFGATAMLGSVFRSRSGEARAGWMLGWLVNLHAGRLVWREKMPPGRAAGSFPP